MFAQLQRCRNQLSIAAEKKLYTSIPVCHAVYFDGKKDKAIHRENGKLTFVTEDQNTIVSYPGGHYLGYVVPSPTPDVNYGKELAMDIVEYLKRFSFGLEGITVLGGDGCKTNLGPWNGVFANIEEILGRPLHRSNCHIHFADNQWRRLLTTMEGPTKGPEKVPVGPICSKALSPLLTKLPVVEFEACMWPVWLNAEDVNNLTKLNNDQQLLLRLSTAIHEGK